MAAVVFGESTDSLLPSADSATALKTWKPSRCALYSAIVPGAGQFYTGHPIKGSAFVALEVSTALVARFWYTSAQEMLSKSSLSLKLAPLAIDNNTSLLLQEGALMYRYDARRSRYNMYNSLSWMIGGYVYNILDAMNSSRRFKSDIERSAKKAAWLAAVPGCGLGQIYNGEISKAGVIMMTQASLAVIAVNEHRLMQRAEEHLLRIETMQDSAQAAIISAKYKKDWESRQNNAFKNRNTYLWYSIFFYFYGILDAVVDAHLHDYDQKMRAYPDLVPELGLIGIKVERDF